MFTITEDHRDKLRKTKIPAYATIIPYRSTKGAVALHTQLSHAKNAVSAQNFWNQIERQRAYREAEIWYLLEGQWVRLWRIEEGAAELPWRKK